MADEPRIPTSEDVLKILGALNAQKVPYALIGGFALGVHGYPRATMDIDILIPRSIEAVKKARDALAILPDQAARGIEPEWIFEDYGAIRVNDEVVVDLIAIAGGETFDSLREHLITVVVNGMPVSTLDLEGLRKTKLLSRREKDLADCRVIEHALELVQGRP